MTTHAHRAHDRHEPEGVVLTCSDCGCSTRMHFSDGCHTAFGFICRCRRTPAQLTTDPRATAREDGGES